MLRLCDMVRVAVALIEAKIRKNIIRWFGHVYCRLVDAVVRKSDMVTVDGSIKRRGRQKLTLEAVV